MTLLPPEDQEAEPSRRRGDRRANPALQLIGCYELGFAVIGVVLAVRAGHSIIADVLRGFPRTTLPFALAASAGAILIWDRRQSIGLSMFVQALQIPFWSFGGTAWQFTAGAYCSVSIVGERANLFVGAASTIVAGTRSEPHIVGLGVNLVPLVVIYLLRRYHKISRAQGDP